MLNISHTARKPCCQIFPSHLSTKSPCRIRIPHAALRAAQQAQQWRHDLCGRIANVVSFHAIVQTCMQQGMFARIAIAWWKWHSSAQASAKPYRASRGCTVTCSVAAALALRLHLPLPGLPALPALPGPGAWRRLEVFRAAPRLRIIRRPASP